MTERERIKVNEVRLSSITWTSIHQAAISVWPSTHSRVRGGAIHGHVKYTRRPRARSETAPKLKNLTIVPLVKSSSSRKNCFLPEI